MGRRTAHWAGRLTTLVRFPDHTWECIEESLNSSFSQFQKLDIAGYAIQGGPIRSVPRLLEHWFSSLKTPACQEPSPGLF